MTGIRALLLASLVSAGQVSAQPANPNADANTRAILRWLAQLNAGSLNRTMSGQMMNVGLEITAAFDSAITKIFTRTGKWVGLIGADYQRVLSGPPVNSRGVNRHFFDYFRSGGLVAVMCSFSNPWTNGPMYDTTGTANYLDLITPGSAANLAWLRQLDSLATGFAQLQDSGITVLWRPFHEMNGPWFWWGSKNPPGVSPTPAQFAAAWQHMFNYLTYTKNLNNILWVYSPSARESWVTNTNWKTETYYYPGSAYVDIVGLDVYNDTLDIPNFNAVRALGKPLAIAEFGPRRTANGVPPFTYDYRTLINEIRTKHPDFVYWMSWNDFTLQPGPIHVCYAMGNQNFTEELLADPWVITREEVNWRVFLGAGEDANAVPDRVYLGQNYPNPFNPVTTIEFELPRPAYVRLVVVDVLGRHVATLVSGERPAGRFRETFNAINLASGVYFYKLDAHQPDGTGVSKVRKLMLMK